MKSWEFGGVKKFYSVQLLQECQSWNSLSPIYKVPVALQSPPKSCGLRFLGSTCPPKHLKLSPCKSEDFREMFLLLCVPGKHCQVPAVLLGDTFIGQTGIERVVALPSSSLAPHPQESGLGVLFGTSCFVQTADVEHRCGDSRAVPWANELPEESLLPPSLVVLCWPFYLLPWHLLSAEPKIIGNSLKVKKRAERFSAFLAAWEEVWWCWLPLCGHLAKHFPAWNNQNRSHMKMCSVLVPHVCRNIWVQFGMIPLFPSHVEEPEFPEKPLQSLGWFHAVASQKFQMLKCFYFASPGDATWPQQHLWSSRHLVSWLREGSEMGRCLFALLQPVYLAPHRCQPPLWSLCCFFGVDISIFTWNQVRAKFPWPIQVRLSRVGAHSCSLCWWQECQSRAVTADRHLPWAMPEHPGMAQHSCCTSVGWAECIWSAWECLERAFASSGFSFPQLPPSCCCFGLFHRGSQVLSSVEFSWFDVIWG